MYYLKHLGPQKVSFELALCSAPIVHQSSSPGGTCRRCNLDNNKGVSMCQQYLTTLNVCLQTIILYRMWPIICNNKGYSATAPPA